MSADPYWLAAGRAAAAALATRVTDIEDVLINGRTSPPEARRHRTDPRRAPTDLGAIDLDVRLERHSRDLAWLLADVAGLKAPPVSATTIDRFQWIATHLNRAPATPSTMRLVEELTRLSAHAARTLGLHNPPRRIEAACPHCLTRALFTDTTTWETWCANPACVDDDGAPRTLHLTQLAEINVTLTTFDETPKNTPPN